jgi:hypothetical protein
MTALEKFLLMHFSERWVMLRETGFELEVYRQAVEAFKSRSKEDADVLDALLTVTRQSPDLRQKMMERYSLVLGTSLLTASLPHQVEEALKVLLESLED